MMPLLYLIGFLFCTAVAYGGRIMRLRPQLGGRIFFWAPQFATAYFRATGMFFLLMGLAGMLFYSVLTLLAVIPRHID